MRISTTAPIRTLARLTYVNVFATLASLFLLFSVGNARAENKTITVPASYTIVLMDDDNHVDGRNCGTFAVLEWSEASLPEGFTVQSVVGHYFDSVGQQLQISGTPPYHDDYRVGYFNPMVLNPPSGSHWLELGFTYGGLFYPHVCTEQPWWNTTTLTGSPTVDISGYTTDVSGKCAQANAAFKKANDKVQSIQKSVSSKAKQIKATKAAIAAAKVKHKSTSSLVAKLNRQNAAIDAQRSKLRTAKTARARAGAAAAKACRD